MPIFKRGIEKRKKTVLNKEKILKSNVFEDLIKSRTKQINVIIKTNLDDDEILRMGLESGLIKKASDLNMN